MARRKRIIDDGDDSDASAGSDIDEIDPNEGADARAARNLFENPYQRKRRRVSDEDEDGLEADLRPRRNTKGHSNWTKAPAFVSGNASKMDVDGAEDDGEDDGSDDEDEGGAEDSDGSEPSRPPSPRVREEEEDESELPGIRFDSGRPPDEVEAPMSMFGVSKGGIGASKGGIGASKGGIGSSRGASSATFSKGGLGSAFAKTGMAAFSKAGDDAPPPPSAPTKGSIGSKGGIGSRAPPPPAAEDFPPSFGRSKPSFIRDSSPSTRPETPLSADEQAHFNKIQGTIGARLLAKMGWQTGQGLGTTGEGIVTPVESKLRPQKMGMGFRGFKEKTEQSKKEAKRRGEAVSDDEAAPGARHARRKEKEAKEKREDVWKRPKKVKTKVEHKTYEQILAEAGQEMPVAAGIGQIIDATGAVPREISSLADVSMNSWSPSNDPTRIPEVRHNIRLIAEACKTDLDGLAREAKALDERKKWVAHEDARLRRKVAEEADLIARLQQVQIVANEIESKSKELASVYEVSLEGFSPLFYKLVDQFSREFERYRLDEIVVAAIAPFVRRMVATWDPLDAPMTFLSTFRSWRRALRVNTAEEKPAQTQVDVYGSKTSVAPVDLEKPMTPFESLLWNVWLPKVRTSINNDWSPQTPQPAVKLYEAWSSFLPPFIRDNLLDQLILPKVKKAVADWNPKRATVSLQSIVFPWLPHLGLRMEDVVGDAQRKMKSLLRSWSAGDAIPEELATWRDVFEAAEWDAMLLKYVVPKLGASLRDEFRVNPRDQIMTPLTNVLQWADIIRPSIFSQILETEFFPKWLDVLHVWLVQPKVSFEEVAQWYSFWKASFPEKVQNMGGVARGFTRGLQLMNNAIELGPDAPTRLPRPDFRAEQASAPNTPGRNGTPRAPPRPSARTQEITFRSIVEDFAATHNLLFIPTGRAHELSRMPLFRVSLTADGKGGILVYILDDAVWAAVGDDGTYRAISLEDMVLRANM